MVVTNDNLLLVPSNTPCVVKSVRIHGDLVSQYGASGFIYFFCWMFFFF